MGGRPQAQSPRGPTEAGRRTTGPVGQRRKVQAKVQEGPHHGLKQIDRQKANLPVTSPDGSFLFSFSPHCLVSSVYSCWSATRHLVPNALQETCATKTTVLAKFPWVSHLQSCAGCVGVSFFSERLARYNLRSWYVPFFFLSLSLPAGDHCNR